MPAKKEKSYTYKQHIQRMNKVEEETKQKEEAKRIGRCPVCNCGGFTLRTKNQKLIRTCQNPDCLDEKVF